MPTIGATPRGRGDRARADRAIAAAIAYAIAQPPDVDVNEIIVRPSAGTGA